MSNVSSTADEILACARNLIIAGGYNGFSYADIADVVGIRKPSIHHHFPSKVDLVRTLVSRYREEVEAGIAELDATPPIRSTSCGNMRDFGRPASTTQACPSASAPSG